MNTLLDIIPDYDDNDFVDYVDASSYFKINNKRKIKKVENDIDQDLEV